MSDNSSKTALVTGASSGIGEATACSLPNSATPSMPRPDGSSACPISRIVASVPDRSMSPTTRP
jgi:hypothetical protein